MSIVAETISSVRSDEELLAEFARRREEGAFAEVVRRHGGMVLAVCQSVLGGSTEAEDAAQAVFLTLAQKASSGHVRAHLVGWLHRVAWYVAARAAAARAIRRRHEKEAARMKRETVMGDGEAIPLEVLHAGLAALPEKYRVALLLHHVEGRTQEETAALLGCGVSAVAMRLSRGREMLRKRLGGRGVAAAGLAGALEGPASASVSAGFVAVAAKAAVLAAGKQMALTTLVSGSTQALSKGAMHMLYVAKLKLVAVMAAVVILTGGAVGAYVTVAQGATHNARPAATDPGTTQATITGLAKALPAYNPDKMNPTAANASVTVTVNGVDTVYEVYGWAGIICAKNDGKTVEVTGAVRKTSIGKMTITAKSIDVKVIVVQ